MTDRMPTPGTSHAARIGEMTMPGARHHRLNGRCPDGRACTLPVSCSQLCSRLESAEIAAEMQAHVRAQRPNGTKKPAPDDRPKEAAMDEPNDEPGKDTVPPPVPVTDYPCKVDGCTNRTTQARGRYAYLCADHRGAVAKPAATPKKRASSPKETKGSAANGKVNGRSMVDLARDLVAVSESLAELERQVEEKRHDFGRIGAELSKAAAE